MNNNRELSPEFHVERCLQEIQKMYLEVSRNGAYDKFSQEATMDNIYSISLMLTNLIEASELLTAIQMRMIHELLLKNEKS